jgi:hypothetical protein
MAMHWSSRAGGEELERAQSSAQLLAKLRVDLEGVDFDAVERCLPRARDDLVSSTLGHDVVDTARRFKAALDAALESGV